jgi:hypothetical protein
MGGIYKVAVEIDSDVVIHIPSFIKIGSGIYKLLRGDTQAAWRSHKPTLFKIAEISHESKTVTAGN